MASTQMNMRIDASLKSSGDLAIRESGSTPSAIVRSVWEYAARNRHKPQAISELVNFLEGKRTAGQSEGVDAPNIVDEAERQVLRGPQIVDECLRKMGVDPTRIEPIAYEEARAAAFDEEWEEALLL